MPKACTVATNVPAEAAVYGLLTTPPAEPRPRRVRATPPRGSGDRSLMAPIGRRRRGRARRLCPQNSDINLFSDGQGVIDLNSEIPNGTLDLRVAEK